MQIAELNDVRIARIETVPLKVKLERAAVGSTPNGFAGEVLLPWRDPFFYRLVVNLPEKPFVNGRYRVPDAPGWGLELDQDYLAFATRRD
jgi:L-alanine-DL-glutamate epimerase-like enolase superfamily enzyme